MLNMNKIPIGYDDFEEVRSKDFYYIDKTKLIEKVIEYRASVTLFTHPSGFGKTFNMSMMKCFFEIGTNKTLFDGLYISDNHQLCEEHLGKYPVVFLKLKEVSGLTFDESKRQLKKLISEESNRFCFLLDSDNLNAFDKERFKALISYENGECFMDDFVLASSLEILSDLLCKHYNKRVIILIDAYDVPLETAFQNGYHREMVNLIGHLFGTALNANDSLEFAILTGVLKLSKKITDVSLSNIRIISRNENRFKDAFGFTNKEVKILLNDYHLEDRFEEVKEFGGGYHYGNEEIFCPQYVMSLIEHLSFKESNKFYINHENDILKRFVNTKYRTTKYEIGQLIEGKVIEKHVRLDFAYDEIDNSVDNLGVFCLQRGI